MKEQIQQLIAAGRTEEALVLLALSVDDALLLQAQFSNGKRQFNMGLIDFNDWQRIQSRINYAALEMAGGSSFKPNTPTVEKSQPVQAAPVQRKVFISYNHDDMEVALKSKVFLEKKGFDVIMDEEDLPPGKLIMDFIKESIRAADAVLSIVSAKSLKSGWVGQESVASMYAVWLADKKFIPVRLDNVAFDIDFMLEAQENIQNKLAELDTKIDKLRKLGGDPRAYDDDRNRLMELKNNLGIIIQRFKSVNMLEITDLKFEANMEKVAQEILR
jgi:hypothetical protein